MVMQTRKYLIDMNNIFSKYKPTTQLEKDLKETYDSFESFVHGRMWELVLAFQLPIELFIHGRKEAMVLDILKTTFEYIVEIHKIFIRYEYGHRETRDYTQLEVLLRDKTDDLYQFITKTSRELGGLLEEKTMTKTIKRKRSKLKKRETMKKKGHTWVKGKGAVKTKEVYSHPKHKYGLRSIHKHNPSK